jgi:hypothetical protein
MLAVNFVELRKAEVRRFPLLGTWPNKGKMRNCRGLYLILLYSSLSLSLSLSIRPLSSFLHCLQRARPFPYLQDSLWGPRQTVDLPSQGDMKDDE